jgi:hypothetical protein
MSQLSWNECGRLRLDEAREHRHRFVHSNITCTPALLLSGYTHPTQYYLRHYNGQIYGGSNTKSNVRIHRQSQLAALLVTVASCVTLSCPIRQHWGKSISTPPPRDYIIPPEFCKGFCMGMTNAPMLNSIPKEVYKSWCC